MQVESREPCVCLLSLVEVLMIRAASDIPQNHTSPSDRTPSALGSRASSTTVDAGSPACVLLLRLLGSCLGRSLCLGRRGRCRGLCASVWLLTLTGDWHGELECIASHCTIRRAHALEDIYCSRRTIEMHNHLLVPRCLMRVEVRYAQ